MAPLVRVRLPLSSGSALCVSGWVRPGDSAKYLTGGRRLKKPIKNGFVTSHKNHQKIPDSVLNGESEQRPRKGRSLLHAPSPGVIRSWPLNRWQ